MENEFDVLFKRIDASLRYGSVLSSRKDRIVLSAWGMASGIISIICLIVAIMFELYVAIIAAFFAILPIAVAVLIFRFYKLKAKIRLWVEDAVEIKAKCTTLGKMPKEEPIHPAVMAIEVVASLALQSAVSSRESQPNPRIVVIFKYNGKRIKKMSGKQGWSDDEMQTGRNAIFQKYIGKEIDILYSPKYDQVLILKQ